MTDVPSGHVGRSDQSATEAAAVGREVEALPVNWLDPPWTARLSTLVLERSKINYANFVDRLADLYGDRTAFVLDQPIEYPGFSGSVLTYNDVARVVGRMAAALHSIGVVRGDRVGLITMNRIEMALCNFAVARLGAIPVPMNFLLKVNEIDFIMNRSGARVLVTDRLLFRGMIRQTGAVPSVETWVVVDDEDPPAGCQSLRRLMIDAEANVAPVEPRSEEDTALIFFTSGTTGFPKGAELSHAAAVVGIRNIGRVYALLPRIQRHLAMLVMPVAHAGGYAAMLLYLAVGWPTYFLTRFDAEVILDSIERYGITLFSGTPAMYRMMLDAGAEDRDLSSVRVWAGGADAFSDYLVQKFRDLVVGGAARGRTGRRPLFIRGYGMAEANSYVSETPPFECGDGCIGWVLPPVRYRIVDEEGRDVPRGRQGELLLTGPTIAKRYWNDPVATESAFDGPWLRTGDIVRRGKWRMLYFVDRSRDIIKSGGYKIAAAEIDQILTQHPDIEHAATVGLPHEVMGERPVSAIVFKQGATATVAEVLSWARERIASYKCPREIVELQEMPMTFSLKPKRRDVRALLEARMRDETASAAA